MSKKKYYKKTDANKNYWCKECEELSENKTCLHCSKQNEKVSEKSWCEEKTNGEECGQLKYFVAEWIGGGGSDHYSPHAYDYECHDQQCQNCEKHKLARDFPWLDETRVCDECWWDAIKKNPEQAQELENYKNSTNAEEKRTYEKYRKLKDKMSKGNNDRERERERESRIANLKVEVQQLEQITNRTTEQEQELKDKKEELAKLEQEKQQGGEPKKINWIPWIIGGVILVLVLGIITYFWRKNKEK